MWRRGRRGLIALFLPSLGSRTQSASRNAVRFYRGALLIWHRAANRFGAIGLDPAAVGRYRASRRGGRVALSHTHTAYASTARACVEIKRRAGEKNRAKSIEISASMAGNNGSSERQYVKQVSRQTSSGENNERASICRSPESTVGMDMVLVCRRNRQNASAASGAARVARASMLTPEDFSQARHRLRLAALRQR